MKKHYSHIFEQARAWAADSRHPPSHRQLAQVLADNSAPLSEGINLDEGTWEAFEQFGCYVCARLGKAHCQTGTTPDAECPLGFGLRRP
jgi:hypothetical protein